MKNSMQLLLCLVVVPAFLSCTEMVNKAKEKAGEMLTEQVEKAKEEAAKQAEAEEAAQAEEAAAATAVTEQAQAGKEETKKADEWWQKDFRLVFDWNPVALGGGTTNLVKHVVLQRRGNAFRLRQEMSGQMTDYIFKIEDGMIVSYLFNADTKKAHREVTKREAQTFDAYIKYQISEHGLIPKKDPSKDKEAKMDGTETFAGRKCEKWVTEKNIFGSISRTTILLDAECRISLKSDFYAKLSGKETSGTVVTVTEFTFKPDPSQVVIDFSNYEMI